VSTHPKYSNLLNKSTSSPTSSAPGSYQKGSSYKPTSRRNPTEPILLTLRDTRIWKSLWMPTCSEMVPSLTVRSSRRMVTINLIRLWDISSITNNSDAQPVCHCSLVPDSVQPTSSVSQTEVTEPADQYWPIDGSQDKLFALRGTRRGVLEA